MQKLFVLLVPIIFFYTPGKSQQKLFDRPVQLKTCKISINANAFVATTEMELEFYNENENEVEGKQYFFLDRGQVVTGFQLELNGKFREGSIEEKRKANNTYNRIVGKRVDPAILQMYNQDQYTLNIYPVPAHGSRKVRIKILQLMKEELQAVYYQLPLNFTGKTDLFILDINTCSDDLYPIAGDGLLQNKLFVQGNSNANLHICDTGLVLNKTIAFSLGTVSGIQRLFIDNSSERKNALDQSSPQQVKNNADLTRSPGNAVSCDAQLYSQVRMLKAYDSLMYKTEYNWNMRLIFGLQQKVVTTQTSYLVLERIEDYINYKIEPPKELEQQCADMNYVYNNESLIRALMEEDKMPSLAYVVENYNDKIYWWDKTQPLIDLSRPVMNVTANESAAFIASTTNKGTTDAVNALPGNSSKELTSVIVTGFTGRVKSSQGYASSIVRGREFSAANTGNLTASLAGKVAGLTVQTTNNGVSPTSIVTLRGMRSLSGHNQPLLIVDNMRIGLDQLYYINPNDIIYINVLKSSSAAAIYGSEAVNGVLIVTTKKGLSRYRPWTEYKLSKQADVEYIEEIRKTDKINLWETYKELEKLYFDEKAFYLDMADYFFDRGLEKEAMIILRQAAERFGASVPGKKTIAYTLERWKKFDEAIAIYKKIIADNSFDPGTKRDLALAYYQKGEYQQALDMYYSIITSESRYRYYDENFAIKAAAMDEMNAVIAVHRNELKLNGININLIRPLPVDLNISVEAGNGISNFQVAEPGGERCNYDHNVTQAGGFFAKVNNRYYSQDACQYTIKHATKGNYRIKVDVNSYYYDAGMIVPDMIRVIVFKNFQTKDQSLEIKNIILDNQYGVVEIDDTSW